MATPPPIIAIFFVFSLFLPVHLVVLSPSPMQYPKPGTTVAHFMNVYVTPPPPLQSFLDQVLQHGQVLMSVWQEIIKNQLIKWNFLNVLISLLRNIKLYTVNNTLFVCYCIKMQLKQYEGHRRTGPVSFRGAEVSCPHILSIACPKINWFCPNITWFFFLPENGYLKISRGLQPPAPPPPRASYAYDDG